MRQFILPAGWNGGPELKLTGEEHHYLSRVLRYAAGAVFPGRDAAGRPFSLTVERITGNYTLLKVAPGPVGTEPAEAVSAASKSAGTGRPAASGSAALEPSGTGTAPAIILYAALLKGGNTDLVIRQATEAGAARFVPLITQNTVSRPKDNGGPKARWEKIAREAAQQCGNPGVPEILPAAELKRLNLEGFSEKNSPERSFGLFFHEKPLENKTLHEYLYDVSGPLHLFFGPEGGFSPGEAERFIRRGINPVYLGDNVLRAETAVAYGIGAVLTILRERNSWHLRKKN